MRRKSVLFAANFPANTGFAWTHIERLFGSVADVLREERGIRTFVAYPGIDEPPQSLAESSAEAVELDLSLNSWSSLRDAAAFIRRENVDVLYLTDRYVRSWKYLPLRLAGVRYAIMHDRISGAATRPTGMKKLAKSALHRMPGITADQYIAVSDFVKRRLVEVGRIPQGKVRRVYNGFPVPPHAEPMEGETVQERFDLEEGTPVIVCACRAAPEKGVQHLLRAFDRLISREAIQPEPILVYCGDGPYMEELLALRTALAAQERIVFAGYLPDAGTKLRSADLFVVPSVWEDALPSAVLEPMAWGRPVVASAVGGVPEMVVDGVTGLLVPPRAEDVLAEAMEAVLSEPSRADEMGQQAQRRVESTFRERDQVLAIANLIGAAL